MVGLKAEDCASGATMAVKQERAASKEEVLEAVDRATTGLRKNLGESLNTIQKFDTPLAQATTPSLEALKSYSLGTKTLAVKGDIAAIPFYQRAIDLDPNFALAYASLGMAYGNLRESDLAKENYQKAFDLRRRVSIREDYVISAFYYNDVTGEIEKADQTYELYSQAYPRAWTPHNNLGSNYASLGQWDKAVARDLGSQPFRAGQWRVVWKSRGILLPVESVGEAKAIYQRALARQSRTFRLAHISILCRFS